MKIVTSALDASLALFGLAGASQAQKTAKTTLIARSPGSRRAQDTKY